MFQNMLTNRSFFCPLCLSLSLWLFVFLRLLQALLTRRDQLKLKQEQEDKKHGKTKENEIPAPPPAEQPEHPDVAAAPKAKGKAKAKAGGKAKAKAKTMAAAPPADGAESPVKTPKRKLFESDEEGAENPPEAASSSVADLLDIKDLPDKMFQNPLTGETQSLRQVFEEYMPTSWRKRFRSNDGPSGAALPEARPKAKAKAKAKSKAKAKAKSQAKAKASPKKKAVTSPSIKKEKQRRKQKEAEAVAAEMESLNDDIFQAHLREEIRKMVAVDDETLKLHLKSSANGWQGSTVRLSIYPWSKTAVGVVVAGKGSGNHVAYFSIKGAKQWSVNMVASWYCAHELAAWLLGRWCGACW